MCELTLSADNFADQWVDQKISISDYSLSASVACGKFCCAMVSRGVTPMTAMTVESGVVG
jgi:hypothetical protein